MLKVLSYILCGLDPKVKDICQKAGIRDGVPSTSALVYICNDFPLFFSVFINIHEYANYANNVRCIFDHGVKGLCLSFIFVQILVLYDLKQLRYY